ncbi:MULTISPECIES: ExeA family protein [unclassified Shewanella]|uniref:ExeA family protein n=1 Tax=unclassified Shewanella TaxID=196818 RepID=UPI001BBA1E51|nr:MULTISPECIES: ExeA family protein [unclassified Shewanella]GIU21467.1 ATPase AAA [Shewanella sp. MBTL60-112-B1]GIU33486.1 ATPase AAA [Shewanella sp. MBTL60-112-B2]
MYKAFFGLNDNPFSIAPNPHYLFLSDRHREALAHLTYGLGETGGFVLLTGEVGTGKTTVSRCLLKQLPDNTDTAFILNPSLTESELLATLCDELGIVYGDEPSLKQLTDLISKFLLENHSKDRNTVLIIDEAQHLRAEVLEQLRLLTNLETDTKKLLQVILIGQPELQQLLKRQELRQLAQRITARYHLLPLTIEEVALYVQHRLQVAGRHEPLFHKSAIKALHKYSGGIPRLINLLCERALMASYAQSKVPIDSKMVRLASAEVLGEEPEKKSLLLPVSIAASLLATFGIAFYLFSPAGSTAASPNLHQKTNPSLSAGQNQIASISADKMANQGVAQVPATRNTNSLSSSQQVLNSAIAQSHEIDTAYASILGLWGKVPYIGLSACQSAKQQGLDCFQQQGNWHSLVRLNYPAVVYLVDDNQQAFYGTVVSRQGEQILLQLNEQQLWVSRDWFTRHFTGTFEILWQAPHNQPKEIGQSANQAQIQWLENSLARINDRAPRLVDHFDAELEQQLKAFQRQHGLSADGIAGTQTLIQLNLYLSDAGPRLGQSKRLY